MSEQSVASTAAPPGSVAELLRQLVESHFVLTDRDGAVTRWSSSAQALFGWEPHAMLGRPLLQTLGLDVAPPRSGGRITESVRLRDGSEVETELVFIPVRMSQSLEFNGFLSALEQMSAAALSVERLRSGHYGVVDWIEASMQGQGLLEEDEMAAGTIVTFRPTSGGFLDDAPGHGDAGGGDYEDYDDFEEIERAIAGTATSAEEARADAQAARAEAAVASERVGTLEAQGNVLREELDQTRALVESLRGDLERTRGATSEETAALAQRLRDEQQAKLEELQETQVGTLEEIRTAQAGTLDELREGLDKVRKRVRQASDADFGAQIEIVKNDLAVLKASSTEDASRDSEALEKLIAEVEEQAKDARKAAGRVEEAAARAGAHAQTASAIGEQLDGKVAQVAEAATTVAEARTAIEADAARAEEAATRAQEQLAAAAKRAEEAAAAAEQHLAEAREAAEQAAVEAEVARVQAEAAQTRPRRRPRSATAPERTKSDLHAPLFGREEDTGPDRELRPGFDDAKEPMATIALDGHFRELNKAFSELVGYQEKEFAACTWPPVMDRANLPKHREQMRALQAGETESVDVNTGYVHAQGLLVPVVGTLSLKKADGQPDHFFLQLAKP